MLPLDHYGKDNNQKISHNEPVILYCHSFGHEGENDK